MSGLLVTIPVIAQHTADTCLASILMDDSAAGMNRDDLLVVDNSKEGWAAERYGVRTYRDPDGHNLGVARAWNVGAREVLDRGLDYLVICSTAMRFGPMLHTTWTRQMDTFWGNDVIECDGHSWHLIAIHRRLFETVGLFDENFYPAYWEATDFARRLRVKGLEGGWPHVWVNAMSQGVALHIKDVACPATPLLRYYQQKWGGQSPDEVYDLPWGDRPLDYFPEHTIPELAAKYRLGREGSNWW